MGDRNSYSTLRESKMFSNILNKFKAAPEDLTQINKANQALAERMDHMMRLNSISTRIVNLEAKPPALVKNPTSVRKAFAA